jgi:glyoxylase-like metal-dependent hydrolase (beta-lactamase superfamily II)
MEVAPGVRWLRMPLPFQLNHINLWLLRDELDGRDGWTIVDCGIDNSATRDAWQTVFSRELQDLPVLRVIVTHMHPDHVGLAHWLTQHWSTDRTECRLWMSATDYNAARLANASITGIGGLERPISCPGTHSQTSSRSTRSERGTTTMPVWCPTSRPATGECWTAWS